MVRERGLAGTTAGVIATAAAGIMDVLAWLVLAAALIGTGHAGRFALPVTVLLIACFTVVMLAVVRPALSWWTSRRQSVLSSPVPVAFALVMASAWVTASLGLHPVFGAFLAGLTMRGRKRLPEAEVLRAMDQTGSLLLPLFFVVTGLSLNVSAMRGDAFVLLVVIVAIACAGKVGPGYGIARASGLAARDAATIAVLVNTRGLTELIALNVGLIDGIINQRLFTVLVLMALITTLTTGPLLSLTRPARAAQPAAEEYVQ
jgi:Kef-type K+ transport system membrane component KefB